MSLFLRLPSTAFALFIGLMLVPFLALPPLGYGLFHQIEPLTVGTWFLGGCGALWCFIAHLRRPKLINKIFSLPVVWTQALILIYALIQCLFLSSALRSLVGTPHLGQGILTFTSLLFLTPPLVLLTKIKTYRKALFTLATLSCLTLSALTILGSMDSPLQEMRYWQWCPVFFPDYIAFGLVPLFAFYWVFRADFKNTPLYHIVFLGILGVTSYYSYNQSIFIAYILGIFTYLSVRFGPFQHISPVKRFGLYLFLGLSTLTLFLSTYDLISSYLPEKLQNQGSLTSRLYLAKMTFIDFFYRPFNASYLTDFLFGQGWGSFNNATLSNIFLVNDISLFSEGTWKPSWEFLDRDLLHSHNFLLETFLTSGLLGLFLFLYAKYQLILSLGHRHLFVGIFFLTGYLSLSAFWFELLHTLPFVMLAHAFLFTRQSSLSHKNGLQKIWPTFARYGSLAGVFLIPISFLFMVFVQQINDLKLKGGDDLLKSVSLFNDSPLVDYDLSLGGFRAVLIGHRLASEITGSLHAAEKESTSKAKEMDSLKAQDLQGDLQKHAQDALKANMTLAQKLFKPDTSKASLNGLVLSLNLMTELASQKILGPLFLEHREAVKLWGEIAQHAHRQMLFRSDIISVYLNHLLSTHQRQKLLQMTRQALSHNSNDPIAHWYQGLLRLKTDEDPSQGLRDLQQAITLGVNRFLPIPKEEIDTIMQAQ